MTKQLKASSPTWVQWAVRVITFVWCVTSFFIYIVNGTLAHFLVGMREWSGVELALFYSSYVCSVLGLLALVCAAVWCCLRCAGCKAAPPRVLLATAGGAYAVVLVYAFGFNSFFFWIASSFQSNPATSYYTFTPEVPGHTRHIAVIGGGPAGVGAGLQLQQQPDKFTYTLYEEQPLLGGHGYGVPFDYVDKQGNNKTAQVDMGFIFGNVCGYPLMSRILESLDIERVYSKISVSTRRQGKVVYASDEPTLADEAEFDRFIALMSEQSNDADVGAAITTFGDWCDEHGFDDTFKATYLTPLFMTLFIVKTGMFEMPLPFIVNMFKKYIDLYHGTTAWAIKHSSREFYDKATALLTEGGEVLMGSPVVSVERLEGGRVRVGLKDGSSADYDGVIIATGANVARDLLKQGGTSNTWEQWLLDQVLYSEWTYMTLHTDKSFLPMAEAQHLRNFNFEPHGQGFKHMEDFAFNALMHRIHQIDDLDEEASPWPILSTNEMRPIPEDKIIKRALWQHYSQDTLQLLLSQLVYDTVQNRNNVAFAGEWLTFIGHDQALITGQKAVAWLGGKLDTADIDALERTELASNKSYCAPDHPMCPPDHQLNDSLICNLERQANYGCGCEMATPFSYAQNDQMQDTYTEETFADLGQYIDLLASVIVTLWVLFLLSTLLFVTGTVYERLAKRCLKGGEAKGAKDEESPEGKELLEVKA